MSDKRKQMRVDVAVRLPVIDINTGEIVGDVANLSSSGFMVLSLSPRLVHSVIQMSMALPVEIAGVKSLHFGAECLWCNATGDQEHYWIGFHLIDISTHDQDVLDQFVAAI